MPTPRPHDALFRSAFENPADAAAELRHVLPASLASRIDWHSLALEPGSFVDDSLADRHSDLLFSARIGSDRVLVYCLLEHQSSPDPIMPLRILGYVVRIWERHAREHGPSRLPAVVPVVVSQSSDGWSAPTCMHELVEPTPASVPGLVELVPNVSFLVDDLGRASNEDLRARALDEFATLALWLLRDSRDPDVLLDNLVHWAAAVDAVRRSRSGFDAVARLLRYVALTVPRLQHERFLAKLIESAPSAKDVLMTIAEQLRAEGQAEGRAEGGRAVLLKLLALKFGVLDDAARQRVAEATEADIERWVARVLVAEQLATVFEPR